MFPKLIKIPAYFFYMRLVEIFSVYWNIVQIYNDKNVKLLNENLINVALEAGQKHDELKIQDFVHLAISLEMEHDVLWELSK